MIQLQQFEYKMAVIFEGGEEEATERFLHFCTG